MIFELERYGYLKQIGEYSEGIAMINLTREPGNRLDDGQVMEIPAWVLPDGSKFSTARFAFGLEFHESRPAMPAVTDGKTTAFVAEANRWESKGECWFDVTVVDASNDFGEKTEGDLALRFEDVPESLQDETVSCYLSVTIEYDHEQTLEGMALAPLIRKRRFSSGRPPDVERVDGEQAMVATASHVWAFDGEVVALTDDEATITLAPVDDDAGLPLMNLTHSPERLPYYGRFEGAHFETYVAVDPDLEALDGEETHPASNRTTFAVVDESQADAETRFSFRWTDSADVSGTLTVPGDELPSSLVDPAAEHLSFSLSYDSDATPDDAEVDPVELWRRYRD